MMHLFRKEKFNYNLYDLELKVEAQQKQIDELRTLVLELSKQINILQKEIDYLSNEKYKYGGKSI
jgi:uncharacterized coiled-coil protein SlyX